MENNNNSQREPVFDIRLATEVDIPYITDGIGSLARMWKKVEIDPERTA